MQNSDNLEELSYRRLYNIYLEEVGNAEMLQELANKYSLVYNPETNSCTLDSKKVSQIPFGLSMKQFKNDLITAIRQTREAIPAPKLSPEQAKAKLIKYIDTPEYKHNQELIVEQRKQIEEQQKTRKKNRRTTNKITTIFSNTKAKNPHNEIK